MDEQTPTPTVFGRRYALADDANDGPVTIQDTEPWRRCWACGATDNLPGEGFCSSCGAALQARTYDAFLTRADTPDGAALILSLADQAALATLPAIWDQVEQNEWLLVVLDSADTTPLDLPLDELAALQVGLALAHVLSVLHAHQLTLGEVHPTDMGLTSEQQPRLMQVRNLTHIPPDITLAAAVKADLGTLARLLESLTATPRTTQRLPDTDEGLLLAGDTADAPSLAQVLRRVRVGELADAAALEAALDTLLRERTHPRPLRLHVGAASHTGLVRDHNEDGFFQCQMSLNTASADYPRGLFIVADGMGGHEAGEVASSLAVRRTAEEVLHDRQALLLDPEAAFDEKRTQDIVALAVSQANDAVIQEGRRRGNDMGTTMTLAYVVGDRAIIANVGDSRTYLYREGRLRRITNDHSLVMRLVEIGQISEQDIYTHPQRNAVLRSLGDQDGMQTDLFLERLQPGDALLLCSDGLWEMTHDPQMEQILAGHDHPQAICDELVAAANRAGGEDNITVVLVRCEEPV